MTAIRQLQWPLSPYLSQLHKPMQSELHSKRRNVDSFAEYTKAAQTDYK